MIKYLYARPDGTPTISSYELGEDLFPGYTLVESFEGQDPNLRDKVWRDGRWADARTLPKLKEDKWAAIRSRREALDYGGFSWDGSTFDSDPMSQSRIQGAVQLASMTAGGFSVDWTLADNSVRALSKEDMLGVGAALAQHINEMHVIARGLRAQIEAATTPEQVNAVAWPEQG